MDIALAIAVAFSALAILSAGVVAFSRNLLHAAFALLGVFAGVLGLYVLLSADFVAVVQLVVSIGGILVLILFAVMLTTKVGGVLFSNRAMAPLAAGAVVAGLGAIFWKSLSGIPVSGGEETVAPTTAGIGGMLLTRYLLPFEIASLLLVLVLAGAVVLARREVK